MGKTPLRVVICGGGNGAHVLAGVISSGVENLVTVLVVSKHAQERWNEAIKQTGFRVCYPNKQDIVQEPDKVLFKITKDVGTISTADVVILCLPAYGHQTYFDIITPHLQDTCIVVGMPGNPGFEYQCLQYLEKNHIRCPVLSTETLPWACRISRYGSEVIVQGTKETVMASVMAHGNDSINRSTVVEQIQRLLGEKPKLKLVDHFLELTMHTKCSLNPPIMYAKWRNWQGQPLDDPPLFYQGIDETAAKCLQAVSDESLAIAEEMAKRCPTVNTSRIGSLYKWLVDHYADQVEDKTTLLTTMRTNKAYAGLVHPMKRDKDGKYLPNFEYRYTTEDVPYGLVVFRAIATMIDVPTPTIDEIISWGQKKLGKEFLVDGKLEGRDIGDTRIPSNYGCTSFEDLVKLT